MSIQNYLTNFSTYPTLATNAKGVKKAHIQNTVAIGAADSATSTYLVFKDLPAEAVLVNLEIENDALTDGTSYSLGLYDSDTGVAKAAACFMSAVSLTAAAGKNAPKDGLAAITHANTLKALWELAGDTLANRKGKYDVVLLANTPSSVAGSITFRGDLIPSG
jgi:hypothetical protein